MGLDTVELAMEVEESFGIAIPDDRACDMRTVGDLYAFVLEETRDLSRDPNTCLTAATFRALRRHLLPRIADASSLRPRSSVEESLPWRNRQRLWARLESEMDLRFPRLRRPSWMSLLACMLVAAASFAMFFWIVLLVGAGLAIFLAIITCALSSALLVALTSPFAIHTDKTFSTYRGLVTQLVALNYAKLSERHGSWSPTDVWNVLQLIIVEQLGVDKENVTPNASFVHDLGAD